MGFSIKGSVIRTSDGQEFETNQTHDEAVHIAQEAVAASEEIRERLGLPKQAHAALADEKLREALGVVRPLLVGAIVEPIAKDSEGQVIRFLDPFYEELVLRLLIDPDQFHEVGWRKWEEIIAASYDKAGFDEVKLTPRSGDGGKDVVAIKNGVGSVRILDEVKALSRDRRVTAKDVRALLGLSLSDDNATHAVLTTTSFFAPGISENPLIQKHIPHHLELIDRNALVRRLAARLFPFPR